MHNIEDGIALAVESCCPHCHGTTGYQFTVYGIARTVNSGWGGDASVRVCAERVVGKMPSTAYCSDCHHPMSLDSVRVLSISPAHTADDLISVLRRFQCCAITVQEAMDAIQSLGVVK